MLAVLVCRSFRRNLRFCCDLDQPSRRARRKIASQLRRPLGANVYLSMWLRARPVALWSNFFPQMARSARACWSLQMNSTATAGPPTRSRLALIAAGIFALLGLFLAPAQAGEYGDPDYRSYPCSYGRCGSRPGLVYERRYTEREYVERRYGWPARHIRRAYGNYSDGGYRSWSRPFPWGYGGVRYWRAPHAYRYDPYAGAGYEERPRRYDPYIGAGYEERPRRYDPYVGAGYEERRRRYDPYGGVEYEEPPRPPAPVGSGDGY